MLDTYGPSYVVSFEIYPKGALSPWASILQLSQGGGSNVWTNYRTGLPAIWFRPGTLKLRFHNALNGATRVYDHQDDLPLNTWSSIKGVHAKNTNGQYNLVIYINDIEVHTYYNPRPETFNNVFVYSSNTMPAEAAANVKIRNLGLYLIDLFINLWNKPI